MPKDNYSYPSPSSLDFLTCLHVGLQCFVLPILQKTDDLTKVNAKTVTKQMEPRGLEIKQMQK